MAIGTTAAIIGSAVIGAAASGISGSKAAGAQKQAAAMDVAEQRRQYDLTRSDFAPWRQAGQGALGILSKEYGIGTGAVPGESAFKASPGYDFRLQEGVKAAERSAAARGMLGSGAAMKAIQRYGEGLASSEYGDWWNRLAGIAGVGQSATQSTAAAGSQAAGAIGNAYQNMGNARASSYANTGSAINQGMQNVLNAYLYNKGYGAGAGA